MTFRLNGPHINQALQGTPDKITIMSLRNHCLRVGLLLALRHDGQSPCNESAPGVWEGSAQTPHRPLAGFADYATVLLRVFTIERTNGYSVVIYLKRTRIELLYDQILVLWGNFKSLLLQTFNFFR